MPGIKRLKKEIKIVASDLIAECETYKHFHPDIPGEKIDLVVNELRSRLKEIIYKVNHYKHVKEQKTHDYFNKIYDQVKNELIPTLDKLGRLKKK